MQNQKTIAKWLAVILLLTLAIACYVALSSILGGDKLQNNVAGAQDQDDQQIQTPNGDSPSSDGGTTPPDDVEEPPHIPEYSQFPRAFSQTGTLQALNIGGEDDDVALDLISCFGKDIVIFNTLSVEHDVSRSGLHLAAISENGLEGTLFIAEDEQYVDCSLSAGGLLVVTRNEAQTFLRLISRELKVTLKNVIPRFDSYKFFTSGGALKMFVADKNGVSMFSISRTLSASKSNRSAVIANASIAYIMPSGSSDMLFLQTDSGISICMYSANDGFNVTSELINCRFEQILPISTDGKQCFALLSSSDDGYSLTGIDASGKQFVSHAFLDMRTAAIVKDGSNLHVISPEKKLSFCSHLEQTSSADISLNFETGDDFKLFSTATGRLYATDGDKFCLLSLVGDALSATSVYEGASGAKFSLDSGIKLAFSSADGKFEQMSFGKTDIYFVIDSADQI